MKRATQLTEAGRRPEWTHGIVNPPVYHASTCVFATLAELDAAIAGPEARLYYGRRGTPTTWALEEALKDIEPGAAGVKLTPSGLSAVAACLLAVLRPGDHLLMVDSAYEPTRLLSEGLLKEMGIKTDYYDPLIGAGIAPLIQPTTKAVFAESPGSLTFEVQDLPAIAKAAHQAGAVVILDNTWATPLLFNGFQHGADMVVHALTKYVVGHSDAMLGSVAGTEKIWPRLKASVYRLGLCAGPDDAYLGLRGLRTLEVRLRQQAASALEIARWLATHPLVDRVLHPALPSCPGHELWRRDFAGASGLFAFTLKAGRRAALAPLLDHMQLFRMGFSWGGYESLILPAEPGRVRTATRWPASGPLLRLSIGLEAVEDLIADLAAGLDRLAESRHSP
ncbi:MAG: cystathionine beta-lyase [Pseudomonadota bacterium]